MSAASQPSPENRRRDLVTQFRHSYGQALADARVSVQLTESAGWQQLYMDFKKLQRERRRDLSKQLRGLADAIEVHGVSEDSEKRLSDIKKAGVELRDHRRMFDENVVEPVKRPADECRKIIAEAMQQAEREENQAPLINVGLVEITKMAIAEVDKVVWDADLGRVKVLPPSAG